MGELVQLLSQETKIKVSSTLDKSVGKKHLTDGSPESCWTSQQGTPQFIQLSFDTAIIPKRIMLTFQGGFVGRICSIDIQRSGNEEHSKAKWERWTQVFPEDINRKQTFELPGETVAQGVLGLKLIFEESSDFFGRITVYDLQLLGQML
ncbi:galactose-binding domain-like protein [Irpex rosettiformis]|uniref:Galactose-binding domain-like protein n=1 Tax=Irpex rosettiformis TaxID=378272 RepID=A0ACB8UL24_9APHY|nr:galactose-binding domain-like protein [Irpex rosettiformis]